MTPPTPSLAQKPADAPKTNSALIADRVLLALGGEPAFVADLLGDLTEEYADRKVSDGIWAARLWYVRELMRSTPHLVWNAVRHGTPAARARLSVSMLAVLLTFSLLTVAWFTRNGPPARLVAGEGIDSEGSVINNLGPVQLSMRVLDAAGHHLERTDVHFQWVSGLPIPVSARGVIKCTRRGDAIVRASLAALKRDFVIHCEPVRKIRDAGWGNFVVGGPPGMLSVDAIGLDGQPVTRIGARLSVHDSTVATLDSTGLLRPLRPGQTFIDIEIGDRRAGAFVTVYEPVRTFEGLRPDQRWLVAPIRLARGESMRWPLPTGVFFLTFSPDSSDVPPTRGFMGLGSSPGPIVQSPVNMSVAGPIMCTRMSESQPDALGAYCLARAPGATLILTYSGPGAPTEIVGSVALEREAAQRNAP